jgi:hypothetical protein
MLKLKEKGQASFEFLLTILFVLAISLVVLNSWFNISDETNAIIMLKTRTIEKLNQADEFYSLRKIEIDSAQSTPEELHLTVFVTPATFIADEPVLAQQIRDFGDEIKNKTKYENVIIAFG